MIEKIQQIESDYLDKIQTSQSLDELDKIYLELFGKNGVITLLPKEFSTLPKEELQQVGPAFNGTKQNLEKAISDKRYEIREESYKKLSDETLDLDVIPAEAGIQKSEETRIPVQAGDDSVKTPTTRKGQLHPITEFEEKIAKLFGELGFQQFNGPDIDTDEYNFGLLNIPDEHPARDMWDTLYVDQKNNEDPSKKLLLRTHATASQVRIMQTFKPPIRMMTIGRCYRYENLDARHEHTFDQFDLLYVDKGLSLANLQFLSEHLLKGMLGQDIKVRLSPGYYPFTEPSAHIFGECIFCKGQGCKVCSNTGELELAGAGMVHPNVLRNGGIDPDVYSGIAWGAGPLRMAMLKYDVSDLRLFNSGDLAFLQNLGGEIT